MNIECIGGVIFCAAILIIAGVRFALSLREKKN